MFFKFLYSPRGHCGVMTERGPSESCLSLRRDLPVGSGLSHWHPGAEKSLEYLATHFLDIGVQGHQKVCCELGFSVIHDLERCRVGILGILHPRYVEEHRLTGCDP